MSSLEEVMEALTKLGDLDRLSILNHLLDGLPADDLLAIATSLFNSVYKQCGNNPERIMPDDFLQLALTASLVLQRNSRSNVVYLLVRALAAVQMDKAHLPLDSLALSVLELILRSLFSSGCEDFHASEPGKVFGQWLAKSCELATDADRYLNHMNSLLFPWNSHRYYAKTDNEKNLNNIWVDVKASYVDATTEKDPNGLTVKRMGYIACTKSAIISNYMYRPLPTFTSTTSCSLPPQPTTGNDASKKTPAAKKRSIAAADVILSSSEGLECEGGTLSIRDLLVMPENPKPAVFCSIAPKPPLLKAVKLADTGIPPAVVPPSKKRKMEEVDWDKVTKPKSIKKFVCKLCYPRCHFLTRKETDTHTMETHALQKNGKYKCHKCEVDSLADKEELAIHLEEHERMCKVCEFVVPIGMRLRSHLKMHWATPKKCENTCRHCVEVFPTQWDLRQHLYVNHLENRPYACDQCRIRLRTIESLHEHNRRRHSNKKQVFECELCERSFDYQMSLTMHMNRDHKDEKTDTGSENHNKEFECDTCGKSFKFNVLLQYHKKQTHKSETVVDHKCGACGKVFASKMLLVKHRALLHPRAKVLTQCTACNLRFLGRTAMLKHYLDEHEEIGGEFACQRCSKTFHTDTLLTLHEQMMHAGKEREYKCHLCAEVFKTSHGLESHINQHRGLQPYACEHCGKSFTSDKNRRRHISEIHTPAGKSKSMQSHPCDACGKEFRTVSDLDIHGQRIHLGNPLYGTYNCRMCEGHFSSRSTLFTHIRRVHHGVKIEKSANCEICGKYFKYGTSLRQHMAKMHDVNKTAFQCQLCRRFYKSAENLQAHAAYHQRQKDPNFKRRSRPLMKGLVAPHEGDGAEEGEGGPVNEVIVMETTDGDGEGESTIENIFVMIDEEAQAVLDQQQHGEELFIKGENFEDNVTIRQQIQDVVNQQQQQIVAQQQQPLQNIVVQQQQQQQHKTLFKQEREDAETDNSQDISGGVYFSEEPTEYEITVKQETELEQEKLQVKIHRQQEELLKQQIQQQFVNVENSQQFDGNGGQQQRQQQQQQQQQVLLPEMTEQPVITTPQRVAEQINIQSSVTQPKKQIIVIQSNKPGKQTVGKAEKIFIRPPQPRIQPQVMVQHLAKIQAKVQVKQQPQLFLPKQRQQPSPSPATTASVHQQLSPSQATASSSAQQRQQLSHTTTSSAMQLRQYPSPVTISSMQQQQQQPSPSATTTTPVTTTPLVVPDNSTIVVSPSVFASNSTLKLPIGTKYLKVGDKLFKIQGNETK